MVGESMLMRGMEAEAAVKAHGMTYLQERVGVRGRARRGRSSARPEFPCFFKTFFYGTDYRMYQGGLDWIKKGASSIQWSGAQIHDSVLKDPIVYPLGSNRKDVD